MKKKKEEEDDLFSLKEEVMKNIDCNDEEDDPFTIKGEPEPKKKEIKIEKIVKKKIEKILSLYDDEVEEEVVVEKKIEKKRKKPKEEEEDDVPLIDLTDEKVNESTRPKVNLNNLNRITIEPEIETKDGFKDLSWINNKGITSRTLKNLYKPLIITSGKINLQETIFDVFNPVRYGFQEKIINGIYFENLNGDLKKVSIYREQPKNRWTISETLLKDKIYIPIKLLLNKSDSIILISDLPNIEYIIL